MVGLGIGAPIVQVYHEKSFILPDVSRVLACLYEKDVKFETHTASYKSLLRLQAASHAPVPFYDGPTFLEESREICRYIAEKYEHQGYPFLLGKDALERASVEQWLHNEEHAFNPPSRALFCHLAFPLGEEDDGIDMHMRKVEEVLEVYDQRLSDSEFLAGNKFTLADLVHLPNSHYIKASDKFLYLYDSRKNVRRWWDAISDRDSWKKVLRYMKRVEEQNKQEELKKQQQQEEEEEDPRTSADSIRLYSRKIRRTKPRTILVPPTDTVSLSSIVPQTKKPLPSDTSPDELLISSSHSTPATDKTSAVQSKETTIFTSPQETPPTSVQSTPVTSKKHSIPVQSTKHATSPTPAKKPPITDAAKSSAEDAPILESSSSKDVSSDLDVFDHYPSHTDVDTPYIEPTTRKTSETLDAFPEPDQPTASDFYKSDSTGTSVDSRFKESVPYSGRTPPELEPTDTSASKLHTTDVHRRLQVEQWHSAKTGLNDLKHDDTDHLVSTQQGKPRKDVQQYPSQDSEQATSHSVPQEPMSRNVLSQLEDYASSDQRGALPPPSTQEHGVTPSRQAAVKDARRRISSQAAYPGGQDTSKQPRDHSSVPRQGEPQDAREIFDESQAPGSTISSERFSYTSQSSLPRQDLDGPRHATAPFEMRYPGAEDTSKQAKDKISTPWQMTDHTGDVKEETKVSESSSFQVQPSYFERADAPSRKQETIDDTFKERRYHSVAPPSQTRYQTPPSEARYPTAEDANKQPRGTAPTPKKTAAQYDNDTSEESKTADEVASTEQPLDAWRSPVSPRRQKVEDSSSSDTSFRKRYPYDEDIQVANTASVSWQIAPDGDKNIFEETKLPDSTPTSAEPVYTPQAPFPPPRQAEVKDAKDKGRQSRVTIPESQKMVSGNAQTTDGERKTGTPGEQSSDRPQAIPQSRLPAAKGLFTKEEITNEQTVVPPLLSNEPTSRVQPAYESLQEVASRGGLSTKPSTIEQWQRATVPLNDITSSSGDGEIGAETPGVQSASPSFPGASTAHHATSDDKFARQSIIDERVGEPTKMLPTQSSAPAHTKRETPGGHEIVDSELVSTPDGHISEAAKIRQDQATVHEDVHDANLSAHDVAKDTFKEAKVAESTPSSAKPMYSQQPAPTPRHAEVEDTWDKGMKGREAVPDRHQMLEKWAGTAGEQVSDRWKASAPSRQAAAEDVRGATGDTIQSPDVLDTSKKSRGAYEEAKGPGSVKEEKTSSIYQKKPLVAQDNQEQAQTIPAGEKADGYMRKHQQASDAPNTFVEKLNASEPARVKTHGDFSAEQLYRKDTTDDQKVAPPLSTRQLTSHVQPPSEPSYDAALHRDLSSKPSTIYQWQRSSAPLHDVTSSSGDDEVAKSTVDDKPTPVSQQKSDEQRVEPPVPIEAEISGVQHASPSFPGASAATGDKFAKRSIIDERVGEPTQTQTSSQDARPSSEPTKRGTPEGHEVGELVSTPGGQISEAKKAGDDPAIVQEDVYDVNLSTQDVGKDAFMETKVADSIPSSAQPMHIQQPALTPSRQRQTQVEEARDKSMQSRETISEQPKMVERKTGISGEHLSDRQKEIRPSRQTSAEDATIQSSDILDTPKKSRATFEESIGPGSTLPKAQVLDAQDSQLTKGESTVPTTDQRKDWKYAKDDESIMTEENSLSTKRLREMFQESASTAPKTQLTDSEGSNALEKTSSVYRKGPLAAQDIPEEAQVIPADEKVYGSTSEHHESFGDPYNDGEKLSVSASARADIHDDHSAEEQYKKYTADDQKVDPSLSSKEPASQVQPASEPLQRAVPDGDLPSKSFTIDQWQRTGAPLHGVITDSGDDGAAMSSNNDQKSRSMSQEATPSSQSVNQMGKQSGEQRVEPPVPIVAEASDVGRAASSLPEAARADVPTISDKFTEQSNIDERMGKPKQMQAPITAAHPASARTMRSPDSHEAGELFRTPEGQRLEAAKATRDPATIHEDVYDASLPTHDAAIDEKTTTDHASGDEVITGSLHDEQAPRPASIQAQPTVETPRHSDSFQYVHTGDSGKAELAKPTVTDQEATVPAAGPTSADPQPADIVPAGVAHSEQKSAPSDKGSARAAQHPSPVEPIKADSNVSAANYTNAPQMIFRQQARPPAPSTIAIRTPDTQGVIGKIQEITPDNRGTDDSGKPFVPNQEHISHASEAIPGQEEMTSPQGARVFPTLGTQLSSADVHEATPDDQQTVESITPLVSSGKQGSHVRSPFKPGEVGPAEKKFAPSDEESPHSSEELISGEPRKEQTVIPTAEQTTAQPTIIGRQDIPDRKQALTSKDTLNNTATQDDVHRTGTIEPARRPLSVEGEELTPATQAPLPTVARDSFHTELENVQSVKPSATPDARDITPSSAPDEAALAEQKSALSGQSSADPAQPAFSLGPMNEIRDSSPSAMLISSTDPSKGDPMVSVRDQAKDSQTTPSQQDILFTEHPSGKVQENIPDDNLRKAKLSRPSSAIQEGKPSKASASGIQLGSVPNELSIDEQKFVPPDASHALSRDQESSPDDGQIRNLGSPVIASQEDASRAGRASEGSTPKVHSAVVDEKRTLPSSQAQTSSTGPDSGQIGGDAHLSGAGMPATSSMEKQEAEPPAATQAPTPKGLQDTANIKSPRQTSTDQTVTPAMNSAAPSNAPEGIEPGPDSSRSVQTPFSTEPTKEDTIATAGDQAEDMQTVTQQQAITPAPDTAKPTFPGAQDASMKFQESIPDDGPVENYSPKPATQTQPPLATLDVSPDASSKAKSTGQGSKPPTRYQASSPETQLGSSQTQGEAAPAEQKFAATDEKSANASKSFASAEPREEDADAAIADQTSVPPTKVTRQVTSSTPDASDALSRDQESSPDDCQIRNLGSPVIASQEDASRAGRASEGSTPKVHSAVVDEKRTLPSSQAQTSSTGPDSGQIGGDAHLSGAGMPATSSMEKQEAEPPAATQAPTPKGLQDTANIKSPRQTSTDQTVTPAMNSAAPSEAPEGIEPGPDSSRSVQTPFSTEPTNEDTIGTAADQAEDMQTVTQQQAFTPDPDTTKPSFPGAQDASRKFLKSIPDDGPLENYSPKPATQTQPHEATLDVSPDASSKAKSTGQGSKPPTRYQASSPETQLGSSQTQGEAAPAEQKFAVTDEKSVNPSKPFASAEPREGVEAAIADQMSVPPTNVTRQVTSSTPDASHALSSDQVSSPDDGQIRNLGSPLIAKDASRAGRASEGSTPKVHSAVVDKKMTLPSSQAQTSSTGPDSGQIGGDARLSGADMPATSSMEKQEVEPPATTQAPTSKGLQDTGNIESPRQTSTDQTVTPAMNSAAPSDTPEGTEPGPHSSRSVQTPFSTEPTKEDTIVTAADAPRSSEESKVQLQSEDSTQGRGTDAPSFETGHPRNGRLPANNYKNNSSQSQAEASNKSIEQSSPDIWNKDNDSSRVDDSTDPTKPET
ncbi:microtubule-associated protein futsch isoform X1 [Sorghum bicolor]|uniref:glutathione transferase n=1 Tax=Sorghum bicolor TaxID=4558 RepID=A0A1W0W6A6_SORBI|nr:microtubule-associated protein futsch isoform X1 [Sorghum bicolor]OQU89855.1 hypothetical protein SORBI_3002G283500 [Sorghum bicolor]|eukprot:XP_021309922.1 microtubule-associated protein futsch isoform X1 [Sorghum bicolor]